MSTRVRVATFNAPHRLIGRGIPGDFQRLADRGVDVIVAQEQTDTDPRRCTPRGWQAYRPGKARSSVVYWNPATMRVRRRGARRVNVHKGASWSRHVVWVHLTTRDGGRPIRVGGVHLPAFKTSRAANAAEFRAQEPRVAAWLAGGKNRVIGGDFNARIPSSWTRTLTRVGRWSDQVRSGPGGLMIDYVGSSKRGRWHPVDTTTMATSSDHRAVIVTLEWR